MTERERERERQSCLNACFPPFVCFSIYLCYHPSISLSLSVSSIKVTYHVITTRHRYLSPLMTPMMFDTCHRLLTFPSGLLLISAAQTKGDPGALNYPVLNTCWGATSNSFCLATLNSPTPTTPNMCSIATPIALFVALITAAYISYRE